MLIKIGQENDNYLQHAIKHKAYEACVYLMTLPNLNFDINYKNGSGNTALHLAIRTGSIQFVRLVLLKLTYLSSESEESTQDDPKYFNMKLLKELSLITNNKGMTPLMTAVDQSAFPIFRLLLELTYFYDTNVVSDEK